MIPTYDVEPGSSYELDALDEPTTATVRYPGWFGVQRDYDKWMYRGADWSDAVVLLTSEREVLEQIAGVANSNDEFYALIDEHLRARFESIELAVDRRDATDWDADSGRRSTGCPTQGQ